ncbi:tetraspanin-8-like [Octopus sinensis]|uniref:Tetraspanin n=1 Tax=Octopus sinensis TaxID=2607531 RepID=A0A7E6ES96_9MOLL|nr:tetraspanin-8-like [Octopus sinensis]
MGLTRCGNFLKYSMFIFNFLILICGCVLLGIGIYTRANDTPACITSLGSNLFLPVAFMLITLGSIVIILSFLGCCGAIKEVRCMLATFFALLLLMLIVLMIGGIIAYVFRGEFGIKNYFRHHLYSSLNDSYGENDRETRAWNCMQSALECCGVEGGINSTNSWAYYKRNTVWFLNQTAARRPYREYHRYDKIKYIPDSCCQKKANLTRCTGGLEKDMAPYLGPPVLPHQYNDQMYGKGCFSAISDLFYTYLNALGGAACGVALLMVEIIR